MDDVEVEVLDFCAIFHRFLSNPREERFKRDDTPPRRTVYAEEMRWPVPVLNTLHIVVVVDSNLITGGRYERLHSS